MASIEALTAAYTLSQIATEGREFARQRYNAMLDLYEIVTGDSRDYWNEAIKARYELATPEQRRQFLHWKDHL